VDLVDLLKINCITCLLNARELDGSNDATCPFVGKDVALSLLAPAAVLAFDRRSRWSIGAS
jgi:hypothetical protein